MGLWCPGQDRNLSLNAGSLGGGGAASFPAGACLAKDGTNAGRRRCELGPRLIGRLQITPLPWATSPAPPPGWQFLSPCRRSLGRTAISPDPVQSPPSPPQHSGSGAAVCRTRSGGAGNPAPACRFMVQEMHFKLVPGYSDPGIRHHRLGVEVGGVSVEKVTP